MRDAELLGGAMGGIDARPLLPALVRVVLGFRRLLVMYYEP